MRFPASTTMLTSLTLLLGCAAPGAFTAPNSTPAASAAQPRAAADDEVRPDAVLLRSPAISAKEIAFAYGGDLWLCDKSGGVARRVTSGDGAEGSPCFSPDGKRLAFTGSYDGGSDIYVLDIDAGVPHRITHHPGGERLWGFTPDGRELLYTSNEVSGIPDAQRILRVSVEGGPAKPLPVPYGHMASIDPTGKWLAYVPVVWETQNWKRYQGGMAGDVWLYELEAGKSRRVTDWPGDDKWPSWHGAELVFLSDRGASHRMNLWSFSPATGASKQLTDMPDFDIKWPSTGPDDVVFACGPKLYRYDFASGKSAPIDVRIPGDRPRLRPQQIENSNLIEHMSVGPTGKRLAVGARGDVYDLAAIEESAALNLTRSSGVAERGPAYSPDGQWIAYFSDRSGEYELTLRRVDGAKVDGADENGEKRLSKLGPGFRQSPVWSPDAKWIAFSGNDGRLLLQSVQGGEPVLVDTNPQGEPIDCSWSADSSWLCFCRPEGTSVYSRGFVYELATRKLSAITSTMYDTSALAFDRSGDFLYAVSGRHFEPTYADHDSTWIYAGTRVLLALPLRADVKNPFAPKDEAEESAVPKAEDGAESAPADSKAANAADSKSAATADGRSKDGSAKDGGAKDGKGGAAKPLQIDLAGLEARALPIDVPPGRIGALHGLDKKVLYLRADPPDPEADEQELGGELHLYDLEAQKDAVVIGGVQFFEPTARGDKLLVRTSAGVGLIDAAEGQKIDKKIGLENLWAEVDPRAEWRQIFVDAWRLFRDYFYDAKMHGVDWNAVRERYLAVLPDCTSRGDLHFLIGEMMAELSVGHAYNRPPPGGGTPGRNASAGLLGCDFALEQGAYRITRILRPDPPELEERSPLDAPGVAVSVGDWLLSVNGRPVDPRQDVYASLLGTAGQPTWLGVSSDPKGGDKLRRVLVEPLAEEDDLRYRCWVSDNRRRVSERSNGRIGYIHVMDTGVRGQTELVKQLLGQQDCVAFVIDDRWNHGGQIPDRFIELLSRRTRNFWALRHGEDWVWPQVHVDGPMCMLINGMAGSGGDCFPYYFRQSKLGKLIGMRTWGGLVGLSGNPGLIDGAHTDIPRFAFFELDGTWGVEGFGVAPDIEVLDDPAQMQNGRDAQLEAGIDELLAQLKDWKFPLKQRPASPNRSGAGVQATDR